MTFGYRCIICNKYNCKTYYTYVRINKKWIKIGLFHHDSKTIVPFDGYKTWVDTPVSNGDSKSVGNENDIPNLGTKF